MASSNSQMESSFAQLTNLINEMKASFDQIFAELQRQRIENEKSYQKQLQDLTEERQKWNEEKLSIEKRIASASPIINLNVGGEKMSTSRATLTLIEGTLLATMFSGKWEDKLMKDADSYIFLDYDPNLFKCLLNQLRVWSDPSIERIFRLPVGCEESFLELVRLLKFDNRFLQTNQPLESFQTTNDSNVEISDSNRRCRKLNNDWACIFGTKNYSTGIHRIQLKLEKGSINVLMGICSRNKLPIGPLFYNKPTTHGWFIHGYMITNGQGSHSGWPNVVKPGHILELTVNCDNQSITIVNEQTRAQTHMKIDVKEASFPWCLVLIFNQVDSQVSLV